MGRKVGGRFKREETYVPMADSCCCLAETNQPIELLFQLNIKKNLKKFVINK